MARKQQSSADSLERVPMLSGMNARARGRLAKTMKERSFPAGRDIVVEGHTGVGFFVITEGEAVVSIGGDPIRTLGPGDYFGEMALIHGETRTATVSGGVAADLPHDQPMGVQDVRAVPPERGVDDARKPRPAPEGSQLEVATRLAARVLSPS